MANRIFSLIGWLGTALVFGAVAIRFGLPAQEQYAPYLAQAGLACMVIFILSQWREILGFFGKRNARYGTLAASSVLIFLGVLVAVNYIGNRQKKRWDLTANQQFSLSEQSRNIVSKLDAPLEVKVFVQDARFTEYRERLQEYEYASRQVKTEYIDPDKQRALAEQNKIESYGTIVFNYKGRSERTTLNSEQDITNAIIKVVTGQQRKVYFTAGHGEHDTVGADRDTYSAIAESLGNENYGVDKVVLAQAGSVPEDATVVVVAGPKTDFFPPEIEALKTYLGKNGKLLLMLDPPDRPDSPPLTNLVALARDYGIEAAHSVVVDASGMGRLIGTDAATPIAANYPAHPITERFQLMTAYPLARPVSPVEGGVNGRTAQAFIESSPRSWAEADLKSLESGQVELNQDKGDKMGPIALGAVLSIPASSPPPDPASPENADTPKPEARIAIIGDSDFATNAALGIQGNKDMFMNTLGWLSQQENLIAIRPKQADDRRLTLTQTQASNVMWLSLLVIPGVVGGAGVYSWWRRR